MTAPSDFLELDRLADDGNPNHRQIEEHWDEPELCPVCEEPMQENESGVCAECWNLWTEAITP